MTKFIQPQLTWEAIDLNVERAKIHGGWLVRSTQDVLVSMHEDMRPKEGYEWRETMCFVPDANHEWGTEVKECRHENIRQTFSPNGQLVQKETCKDCGDVVYEFNRGG